jgi:cysteine desulfurase family protein
MDIVYLDNAATTWPKPQSVIDAVHGHLLHGVNPGRGNYKMSVKTGDLLFETRVKLAKLFNIKNHNSIIFTLNATHALNQAIHGYVKAGSHVITTTLEHNSVRRPLEKLRKSGQIEITYISPEEDWTWDLEKLKTEIRKNTVLIIVSHVSNLIGSITPIEKIGSISKEFNIPFLVDASQSAGVIKIDVQEMHIDMLAFPGHKGLYGPPGTGGLYLNPQLKLEPLMQGGTGNHSEDSDQPQLLPFRYESGTQNTLGISGLLAGVNFVMEHTVEYIYEKEMELTKLLIDELKNMKQIKVYGPDDLRMRTGVISFNVTGIEPILLGHLLDEHFGIALRTGFHCTPLAHQTAGSFSTGSLRASFGFYNSKEDVYALVTALKEIIEGCTIA